MTTIIVGLRRTQLRAGEATIKINVSFSGMKGVKDCTGFRTREKGKNLVDTTSRTSLVGQNNGPVVGQTMGAGNVETASSSTPIALTCDKKNVDDPWSQSAQALIQWHEKLDVFETNTWAQQRGGFKAAIGWTNKRRRKAGAGIKSEGASFEVGAMFQGRSSRRGVRGIAHVAKTSIRCIDDHTKSRTLDLKGGRWSRSIEVCLAKRTSAETAWQEANAKGQIERSPNSQFDTFEYHW
jgi:hypothetical protein